MWIYLAAAVLLLVEFNLLGVLMLERAARSREAQGEAE